jgi:predicted dienelactone hydrolase
MNNKIIRMTMMVVLASALLSLTNLTIAQDAPVLPLAERGSYVVGERTISLVDESRDNREIVIELWYPAVVPEGSDVDLPSLQRAHRGLRDAPPAPSVAPFPLILYSHSMGGSRFDLIQFTEPIASRGFVVVGLNHPSSTLAQSAIDRPLDILFVLNQLAALTEGDLVGVIDTNIVGVMGNCFGGYTALTVNGTRIDPVSAGALTANPLVSGDVNDPRTWWRDWNWDELAAYRAQFSPPLEDEGMWPPFTDERIHAVLAFSPCLAPLFGEQGLAAATVPTLIVGGTADQYCLYEHDAVFDYLHLGSADNYLLTIIGGDHFTYKTPRYTDVSNHFATAFFGRYLQGQEDYAQYLTTEYVDDLESQVGLGLVWGVYQGE